jgi:hypothetical protein
MLAINVVKITETIGTNAPDLSRYEYVYISFVLHECETRSLTFNEDMDCL